MLWRQQDSNIPTLSKVGKSWPLFNLFSSFQTNITIFTTNIWEKMSIQYTVLGFETTTFRTWVSSHDHWTRAPACLSRRKASKGNGQTTWSQQPLDDKNNTKALFYPLFNLNPSMTSNPGKNERFEKKTETSKVWHLSIDIWFDKKCSSSLRKSSSS